ncbi:MAG: cytochrome c [Bacteroidetes bacterium]|nr:cytochrome c [Bacteroidota bacterium]
MKKTSIAALTVLVTFFFIACGGSSSTADKPATGDTAATGTAPKSDDKAGVGKFKNVEIADQIDEGMVATGQKVFDVKCMACHKLTDEKLVGPGWKGVTSRRTPEWILNFATNTEEMLNKDATAMSLLEICLVKMPNQNLADEEARGVLEFMRKNDVAK